MISCPNCQHQNPDGATQCEACYTPLPTPAPIPDPHANLSSSCPNCGAPIETHATFCGQCGFNLVPASVSGEFEAQSSIPPTVTIPPTPTPDLELEIESQSIPPTVTAPPVTPVSVQNTPTPDPVSSPPIPDPDPITLAEISTPQVSMGGATQLQIQTASLFHVQTGTKIELQQNLAVIHIGKPNDQIPPDIDVSGFPNSEIVSRIHSDIRVEGDSFFIEDVGSSNGTYINHTPLSEGNRHRLRPGDRIALGKGDKMTFIFQMS